MSNSSTYVASRTECRQCTLFGRERHTLNRESIILFGVILTIGRFRSRESCQSVLRGAQTTTMISPTTPTNPNHPPIDTHLVNRPRPLILSQPRLHPRKSAKHPLSLLHLLLPIPKEFQCRLEHLSRFIHLATIFFKLGPSDPVLGDGSAGDPTFVQCRGSVFFVVSFFELDVRLPGLSRELGRR